MSDCINRAEIIEAFCRSSIYGWSTEEDMIAHEWAFGIINNLPSAQQWIPCSERLPENDIGVFVYLFDSPSPYIAWIKDTHWYTEDFEVDREDEPIAWMPLPDPYKGGDADDD